MPTTKTASAARFELTLRVAQFIETRFDLQAGQRAGKASLLDEIVSATNDLQPLFAAYEASVQREAFRDTREEVYATVADSIREQIASCADESIIVILERLLASVQRARALAQKERMERAGDIQQRIKEDRANARRRGDE